MKKQRLKRAGLITTACLMLVSLVSGAALADVIWTPDDDFFNKNMDKCEYVNRDYYANGENGYLEVFTEPGGTSLGFADNGSTFHVQFSYNLGDEVWGVVEYAKDGDKIVQRTGSESEYNTGWVKMSDTVVKFDYISFDDAHSSEYTQYDGDYSELKDVQNIQTWTFPDSGETSGTIDQIDENYQIESVYTDIDGAQWGYTSYYYGMKNFWVCLSDPANANLAAKDVPVTDFYTPAPDSAPKSAGSDITTVIIICVAAAILISVVLINVTNKKKKDTNDVK